MRGSSSFVLAVIFLAYSLAGPAPSSANPNVGPKTLLFRYAPQRSATFVEPRRGVVSKRVRVTARSSRVTDYSDRGIAVQPNGRYLYEAVASFAYLKQYRVRSRGRFAPLSPPQIDAHSHPMSISLHPGGRFVYVSCSHGAICQYRLDRSGRLVRLSPDSVFGNSDPSPLLFDRTARFACVVTDDGEGKNTVYVYRIRGNGTLSLVKRLPARGVAIGSRYVVVHGNRVNAGSS